MVGEEVGENYFPLGRTGGSRTGFGEEFAHERDPNILSYALVPAGILSPKRPSLTTPHPKISSTW